MRKRMFRLITGAMVIATVSTGVSFESQAKTTASILPSAGIAYALDESLINDEYSIVASTQVAASAAQTAEQVVNEVVADAIVTKDGKTIKYEELVVAQVNNYVNVRDFHDENTGNIVGKLYNNSVGTLIKEEDGWYQITSGNCTGWVKGEFCVKGLDAVEVINEVSTTYATVTTTTLKVRSEASMDATVLGMIPLDDDFVVMEENDEWVKISTEFGEGFVSKEYVSLNVEFVYAESKAEEEARLAKEKAEREAAQKAAAEKAAEKAAKEAAKKQESSSSTSNKQTYTASGSGYGSEVASYALQFVGNPYVFGGTSLTNGADCSGFVMSVYANFGVSLPHSSKADRSVGYEVEGGLANAQAGDIVCYSGHVALYIGNGQIVHASTSKTGIIVSNANYKTPITVRRIF